MLTEIAQALVGLVAVIQIAIAIGEVFLWKKVYKRLEPKVVFSQMTEVVNVAPIVKNVGLYNAFLAAGLIWGLVTTTAALEIQTFFLGCVLVAGIFGAITLKWTTLVIQAIPSLITLIAVWYAHTVV